MNVILFIQVFSCFYIIGQILGFVNRHTWIRTRDEEVEAPSDNPLHHMPMRLLYHSLGQSRTQGAQIRISPPRTDWA
jgi:hypothetical protein